MPDQSPVIEVLGSGCASCQRLYVLAQQAANALHLGVSVGYVTDVQRIVALGLMSSPVLTVNGAPVLVGVVPDVHHVTKVIDTALQSTS